MRFFLYHAIGNDYVVLREEDVDGGMTPALARRICHRNFGVGSDGILLHLRNRGDAFNLRIFNPDGSESEKSGNGLRIFARYLYDQGRVGADPFVVTTPAGDVTCRVTADGRSVTVEMGTLTFDSTKIPVAGEPREVLREHLAITGVDLEYSCASIGNPHCVLLRDRLSEQETRELGSRIEVEPRFPYRTNVQFVQVLDRRNIAIQIWERGAGFTLASGSSSCAAAGVMRRLGLCDDDITVHMPGGTIRIEIAPDYALTMTGPVTHIADGEIDHESLDGAQ